MSVISNGLRRVTVEALALACDVPTRQAKRFLKARFSKVLQPDGSFGLTEFQYLECVRELRKKSPVYMTGFQPQRRS